MAQIGETMDFGVDGQSGWGIVFLPVLLWVVKAAAIAVLAAWWLPQLVDETQRTFRSKNMRKKRYMAAVVVLMAYVFLQWATSG